MAFHVMWLQYRIGKFLRNIGVIADIMIRWMLAFCAGGWAFAFFVVFINGKFTLWEPSKSMTLFELSVAVFLTLCGVILSLSRTRYIK